MRIISRKALRDFWEGVPGAKTPLSAWYKTVSHASWESFAEVRRTYGTADQVGKLVVFNVGGDKYRLVASIHYNTGVVYVRRVMTHAEYDRGDWKE